MSGAASVTERVAQAAAEDPDRPALTFIAAVRGAESQRLSYAELWTQALGVARWLCSAALRGRPVLLLHHAGPDFAVALLGCLAAGAIAVPAPLPTFPAQRARLAAILRLSSAAAVLSTEKAIAVTRRRLAPGGLPEAMPVLLTDVMGQRGVHPIRNCPLVQRGGDEPALLQFSSGSTGDPTGVVITQANLVANVSMIAQAFGGRPGTRCLSWLPHTHDMGLVGGILAPLATRCETHLLSPDAVLQRPLRWLSAIADNQIEISGGPDFAYALVADRVTAAEVAELDLRVWRAAYVGAEPVRAATLDRFSDLLAPSGFDPAAFLPCYGLAEATLLVTAAPRGGGAGRVQLDRARLAAGEAVPMAASDASVLVRCGVPAEGTALRILKPGTGLTLPRGRVGEIAVSGPQVSHRRYPNAEAGNPALVEGEGRTWLRTGDLGFLDDDGLVVVDRLKDVLVVHGRNHACHDVEATAAASVPPGLLGDLAALLVDGTAGTALVILAELGVPDAAACERTEAFRRMRGALLRTHGLGLSTLVLTRRGKLVRTPSGKLRRQAYRDLLQACRIEILDRLGAPLGDPA